jgi:hypothetical protein
VLADRPARRLNATWSEAGVEQRATALAARDAWVYVSLLAWGPATAGADLEAAFDQLAAGLDVSGALERRLDARATELLGQFPELSRPSVEVLVRLAGEVDPGPADLAATVVTAVDRGLRSLSPSETRAFREIYARVFEPLSDADRQRLAAWQQKVRQGESPAPGEGLAVREAVRASLDRMPGEMLVELQLLHEKAILSDIGG